MSIKLSEVIAIWDEMTRIAPTAVKGFCDLDKACEKVLGVVNDCSPTPDGLPRQPVEASAGN